MGDKTCGDFGGEKTTGEPCTRKAGWGTDNDEGRCKSHNDEKDEKIQDLKKEFVNVLEDRVISIKKAAHHISRDQSTVWRWRQEDPEFDREVEQAKRKQQDMRVERVENALYRDCIEGKASAAERIFWLKNMAPEKWQDKKKIEADVDHTHKSTKEKLKEAYEETTGLNVHREDKDE